MVVNNCLGLWNCNLAVRLVIMCLSMALMHGKKRRQGVLSFFVAGGVLPG